MQVIRQNNTSQISIKSHDTTDESGLFIQISQTSRATENSAEVSTLAAFLETMLTPLHHDLMELERIAINPALYPDRVVRNRPLRPLHQEIARYRWIAGQPHIKKLPLTWEDVRGYLNEASVILHNDSHKV